MESEEHYIEFERENDRLREGKRTVTTLLIIFIITTVLSIGYIALSEFDKPLFGKWPKMANEYEAMQIRVDSLVYMKYTIDSLASSNMILAENSEKQDGVFFEVQIGAFEKFNLEKYKAQLAKLRSENVDKMDKYSLGKFRNYYTANAFKRDIEKMGIKGAFIVGKIDGQRVDDISKAIKASRKKIYR
ncbi:MAG TPA: hypothetical protein VD908_08245 [Cytophagales bacterium]|nr:hypothetical protein [Cytophagales bacterium]